MTRLLIWGSAAAVVLTCVLCAWARYGPSLPLAGPAEPAASSSPCPERTPAPRPQAPTAPDGGRVTVLESGFATVGGNRVSIGAVLDNSSAQVAYRTRVTIRALDARGGSAVHPRSGELLVQEIPIILPGQRIGVGAWAYLGDGPRFTKLTPVSVRIELGPSQWWPVADSPQGLPVVSAAFRGIRHYGGSPHDGVAQYTATVDYCRPLAPRLVAALYRDRDGRLAGGSLNAAGALGHTACEPGAGGETLSLYDSMPAGTDEARTEIYPYCDFAPRDPAGLPPPVN
ncbi:hypothetical protein Cs7R123_52410 [Catellatospora sp. TT07R-123]|uniref:hypothetical protein n=1 Tax=Catellatospora sp. TT07R-123 TaxID=2733863 RepID=UPI001B2ECBBF|nr:hypothetical protein [Catellatospora sp. TT07R-123]GHJ47899.1 hypothetical protein Cs7R123_52410 [Catellatospora sp. TT07R-123]